MSVLRCTDYNGNLDGRWTDVDGKGFQCLSKGDGFAGVLEVETESFRLTVQPEGKSETPTEAPQPVVIGRPATVVLPQEVAE